MIAPDSQSTPPWHVRLFRRIFDIRPEEVRVTLLMFTYFATIMAAYYIIKPATRSLFMQDLGARNLPYVYLGTALLIGFVASMFEKLVDKVNRVRLVDCLTVIFISNLLLFRFLLPRSEGAVAAAFYIWGDIFSVMVVTVFYSVMNDTFNPDQGKRLYGIIGAGAMVGGFIGGQIAGHLAISWGTENLLFISAAILLLPCVVIRQLEDLGFGAQAVTEAAPKKKGKAEVAGDEQVGGMRLIMSSSYLQMMIVMLGLTLTVSVLVEQQFMWSLEETVKGTDARTAYTSSLGSWTNAFAFVCQLVLTGPILKSLGVLPALLILPMVDLLSAIIFLTTPLMSVIFVARVLDGALKYSVNQVTKEVLYLPTTRAVKYKAKAFIDMFFYRAAKGVAALLILFVTNFLGVGLNGFSMMIVGLTGLWVASTVVLYRGYCETLGVRVAELTAARQESSSGAERRETVTVHDPAAVVRSSFPELAELPERAIGTLFEEIAHRSNEPRILMAYRLCVGGKADEKAIAHEYLVSRLAAPYKKWGAPLCDPKLTLEERRKVLAEHRSEVEAGLGLA